MLGDTSSANPCTWWDDIYLTQPCQNYLQANDPTNPLLVMVQQGAIVGGAQVLGTTVGTSVSTAVNATATSLFVDPTTGNLNITTILVVGLGLYVTMKLIGKFL